MAQGSHAVDLTTGVFVRVTGDTLSPFTMVNESNDPILWIASTTQPAYNNQSLKDAVRLTSRESMSRFEDMDGCHLYVMGDTGTHVVMIDPFRP